MLDDWNAAPVSGLEWVMPVSFADGIYRNLHSALDMTLGIKDGDQRKRVRRISS